LIGKYSEIERQNKILLEKMASIMSGTSQQAIRPFEPSKEILSILILVLGRPIVTSLNHDRRRKDQEKIAQENSMFLKRL
jgi:hypothetical protein